MNGGHPLFIDITWHPAGNPDGDSETSSAMIAQSAINYVGLETMLHMTCRDSPKKAVTRSLQKCKNSVSRERSHYIEVVEGGVSSRAIHN